MAEKEPHPGTEIVPRRPDSVGSGVPTPLLLATDLAVGAAAQATRAGLRIGAIAWDAGVAIGRVVSALPGADGAGRLLEGAARPLLDDGQDVRARAGSAVHSSTQRLLEAFAPSVVDSLDIDAIVQRIDIDRLVRSIEIDDVVRRIEIDALVQRIDIDRLVKRIDIDDVVRRIDIDALVQRIVIDDVVRRIDIDALVQRIDIDRLVQRIEIDDLVRRIEMDVLVERIDVDAVVGRIDVGGIAERIDVNEVVQRVDVDAIVEETELGTIVARSTSGFASAALDAARSQTAGVDTRVSRAVNRVLRRNEGDMPVGPPLLRGGAGAEQTASEARGEPAPGPAESSGSPESSGPPGPPGEEPRR